MVLTVIVQIGIVFGAVVVETKGISKFLYSDMTAVGRSKDGEIIDVDILLQRRSEQLFASPIHVYNYRYGRQYRL